MLEKIYIHILQTLTVLQWKLQQLNLCHCCRLMQNAFWDTFITQSVSVSLSQWSTVAVRRTYYFIDLPLLKSNFDKKVSCSLKNITVTNRWKKMQWKVYTHLNMLSLVLNSTMLKLHLPNYIDFSFGLNNVVKCKTVASP